MGLRTRWRPGDDFLLRHKDAHVLVVEKKAGMLTHASREQDEKSLLSSLRHFLGPRNPIRGVHRLDRVVSGLLVFARSERAFERLTAQFAEHSVERRYVAGVAEAPARGQGRLEDWLDTEPMEVRVVAPETEGARRAVTHYAVRERHPGGALLEVRLETGLRNQIRVQLAHHGHPLLGERKYASPPSAQGRNRIFLHAEVLGFDHPITRARHRFEAALPPDLERWRRALEGGPAPRCPAPRIRDRPPRGRRRSRR